MEEAGGSEAPAAGRFDMLELLGVSSKGKKKDKKRRKEREEGGKRPREQAEEEDGQQAEHGNADQVHPRPAPHRVRHWTSGSSHPA